MKDKREQRRGGFYWIDKEPYVSVTEVLKCISKPQIQYWFGKQIYLAMCKDPTLSQAEAMAAPYKKSDKARSRGSTVHSLIQALKGGAKIGDVPEEFTGYKTAFEEWWASSKIEVVENEKTVVSKKDKFAGTLDMLAKVDGRLCVVDFKTSKDGSIYQEAELQMAAYYKALQESGVPVVGAILVGLGENGGYTHKNLKSLDENYEAFLATKRLWFFLNREECEKIGYGL